jgi:murein L,D-transpeptidase YcbB/YkuD
MEISGFTKTARFTVVVLAFAMVLMGLLASQAPTFANAESQSAARCLKKLTWDPVGHGYGFYVPGNNSNKPNCLLEQGDAAPNGIKVLQQSLVDCNGGYVGSSGIDGVFGTKTKQAVIKLQKAKNLTQDGVYGNNTRNKMKFEVRHIGECSTFYLTGE